MGTGLAKYRVCLECIDSGRYEMTFIMNRKRWTLLCAECGGCVAHSKFGYSAGEVCGACLKTHYPLNVDKESQPLPIKEYKEPRARLSGDYNGTTMLLTEISKKTGIPYGTLVFRRANGFSLTEKAPKSNYGRNPELLKFSDLYGIPVLVLQQRIKGGMSMKEAAETPLGERPPTETEILATLHGINHSTLLSRIRRGLPITGKVRGDIAEAARTHGINYSTLKKRMRKGMTLSEAIKYKK